MHVAIATVLVQLQLMQVTKKAPKYPKLKRILEKGVNQEPKCCQ